MKPSKPVPKDSSKILVQQQSVQFSGPLPPPVDLQAYENTLPGLAERIVVMAETEQRERIKQESAQLEKAFSLESRGQIFAFLCVLLLAASAVACAFLGVPSVGIALAGVTLAGVVASFLRPRNKA
jgi:uncharacterized membrane protein